MKPHSRTFIPSFRVSLLIGCINEFSAKAGIATVRTTFDNIFPNLSVKMFFLRKKKPSKIIKIVEVIELMIPALVTVFSIACITFMNVNLQVEYYRTHSKVRKNEFFHDNNLTIRNKLGTRRYLSFVSSPF